jgi:hypothetical protein
MSLPKTLKDYAQHAILCDKTVKAFYDCTCGLDALLQSSEGPQDHDPLCSEGEVRGDQVMDCDCSGRKPHPAQEYDQGMVVDPEYPNAPLKLNAYGRACYRAGKAAAEGRETPDLQAAKEALLKTIEVAYDETGRGLLQDEYAVENAIDALITAALAHGRNDAKG